MGKPWDNWIPGVLNKTQMEDLVSEGFLTASEIGEASIDLTLTNEVYRMTQGSVKPGGPEPYSVTLKNPTLAQKIELDADGTITLDRQKTYVFKLAERLHPKFAAIGIHGQATAKSSVGRVDVLARLIVDGMDQYESFTAESLSASTGDMYLEVTPFTFRVKVKARIPLTQLRLFYGDPKTVEISGEAICRTIFKQSSASDSSLSVDLSTTKIGTVDAVAFCAEKDKSDTPIPLWKCDPLTDPSGYWLPVGPDGEGRLKIENDRFYILRSKEKIRVPLGIAIYCRASDETIGEMRIHYAGFVHPGFGMRDDEEDGTPLIFEVRGHQVDVNLRDGERLANLVLYRMSQDAQAEQSDYGKQTLKLSGFFAGWSGNDGEENLNGAVEAAEELGKQ